MIALIDYGMGNLKSVKNALYYIGANVKITASSKDLALSDAIILPGVGAFADGMNNLKKLNLIPSLNKEVIENKKPYLGICLGMQFIAKKSYENGCHDGLGWVEGEIKKIDPVEKEFRVPHIGWNDVTPKREEENILFEGLPAQPVFYFVHSYHLCVDISCAKIITSTCQHGGEIVSSIQYNNIFGVQFHPEKSQSCGMKLLNNFANYIKTANNA